MYATENTPAWSFKTDTVERYAFWDDVFSKQDCQNIIDIISSTKKLRQASVVGDIQDVTTIRDSNIVFINPEPSFEWVYRRLTDVVTEINSKFFQFELFGFTEGLQFTEYVSPTGKYDAHIDKIYNGTIRKLSIVVQLSDPETYVGGDLELIDADQPEKMSRSQGRLLAFPSYTLHRVTPVVEGTRYSLVGWISGPPFK